MVEPPRPYVACPRADVACPRADVACPRAALDSAVRERVRKTETWWRGAGPQPVRGGGGDASEEGGG